jgi:uncharacterized protein YqjF (DUF2071 family)
VIVGYQEWRDLLFLHWRVPAAAVRPHVPRRLQLDERDGGAWVSMTPFTLRRGRLRGLPPLFDFHELNFRTYVTLPGRGPGIWFFSLDAASAVAVVAARVSVRLPYFLAHMERDVEVREELSRAAGLPRLGAPTLAHWSPGVAVDFHHIRPC